MGSRPVLVTGGAGFVGCGVVRRLLARGDDVHVFLRGNENAWRLEEVRERLTVHAVDVVDGDAVRRAVLAIAPAAVFHLATHGAYETQSDARRILETNVIGSHNVLEASASAGVAVFVNAGSSSEYGYRREPMREDARLDPNRVYAVATAAQTHLATRAARRGAMAVATFRLFSVYGPWEEPTRVIPTLIRRARAGEPLEMAAPETARDFVYLDDVVDALVDVDRVRAVSGEVVNLGTGVESTLRDVVAAVQAAVGARSEVRWGAMPARRWDTDRWQADVTKARDVLGWSPRHSLRDGVARTAAWMAAAGDRHARA